MPGWLGLPAVPSAPHEEHLINSRLLSTQKRQDLGRNVLRDALSLLCRGNTQVTAPGEFAVLLR